MSASSPLSRWSLFFFFSSRRRHTRFDCDWSSDVCSSDLLSSNPLFALPVSLGSSTNAITLENPFPAGTGISLGPFAINPNFDDAYAQDWNLTIQRQLSSTLGVEVAYVGVKGTHLQILQNINQPFVTNGFYSTTRPFPTLPATSPVFPSQCATASGCPLGNLSGGGQVNTGGNSNYNALWATINKHFSH